MMKRQHSALDQPAQKLLPVLVLVGLLVPLAVAPASADDRSGLDVVALCSNVDEARPAPSQCTEYFDEVLQLLKTDPARGRLPACPPASFGPKDAISLYLSEARQFPQVLQVPAEQLIEGMLLKFYPCISV